MYRTPTRSLGHGGDEADNVVILQRLHNAGKVVLRKFAHRDPVAVTLKYCSTSAPARGVNICAARGARVAFAPFVRVPKVVWLQCA